MRRQALPLLHELLAGRDQRQLRLLDIGCGTGRFLDFVKQAWPRLQIIGLDMSDAYVRHARRYLRRWSRTRFVVGKAEAIPFPDSSQDAVTSIFCSMNCHRRCGAVPYVNALGCSSQVGG